MKKENWEASWNEIHRNMVGLAVEKVEKDFIRTLLAEQRQAETKEQVEAAEDRRQEIRYWAIMECIEALPKEDSSFNRAGATGTSYLVAHREIKKVLEALLTKQASNKDGD